MPTWTVTSSVLGAQRVPVVSKLIIHKGYPAHSTLRTQGRRLIPEKVCSASHLLTCSPQTAGFLYCDSPILATSPSPIICSTGRGYLCLSYSPALALQAGSIVWARGPLCVEGSLIGRQPASICDYVLSVLIGWLWSVLPGSRDTEVCAATFSSMK